MGSYGFCLLFYSNQVKRKLKLLLFSKRKSRTGIGTGICILPRSNSPWGLKFWLQENQLIDRLRAPSWELQFIRHETFWNEVLALCCLLELYELVHNFKHQSSRNNLVGQSRSDLLSDRGIYWGNAENILGCLSKFFLEGFIKGWMLPQSPISAHVCFKVGAIWC